MADLGETVDATGTLAPTDEAAESIPGLLAVFSSGAPLMTSIPIGRGTLTVGRGSVGSAVLEDARLSRAHAQVWREAGEWVVRDLESKNGTSVDGQKVEGTLRSAHPRVLRAGDTLFLFSEDLRPYARGTQVSDGVVLGPTLQTAWTSIAAVAKSGTILHVFGPSGAGKELAARHFHRSGSHAGGPFVALNCATIPAALAERILFGAKKGAYSGAEGDVDGAIQEADGGTLFLDELAELDLTVQAKLLRVIETREVLPLGAARGRAVDLRVVSATHGDLRAQIAAGRFREDLFFRLGRPAVTLPALGERREDIPWLLREILATTSLPSLHASLVEAALLLEWPGNVRELGVEIREAVRAAELAEASCVLPAHLDPQAGRRRDAPQPDAPAPRKKEAPDEETIRAALERSGGNVSEAARILGVHRTQLRRWMGRLPRS